MSGVACNFFFGDLLGGGFVINGLTLSSFHLNPGYTKSAIKTLPKPSKRTQGSRLGSMYDLIIEN